MITRTGIRALCNSTTYSRGLEIYRSDDKIQEFKVEEKSGEDIVDALVKGGGQTYYPVKFKYDKRRDCLDNIYCDCNAFYNGDGICRHCVAVLLEYADYRSMQKAIAEHAALNERERDIRERNLAKRNFDDKRPENFHPGGPDQKFRRTLAAYGIQVTQNPPSKPTTSGMKNLLNKRYLKRTAPLTEQDTFGKVRLEPYLTCRGTSIQVEFRIGVSRMYVLKDIFQFVQSMKDGRDYFYGQKLQFVHIIEAFEQDSRSMVQFIIDWEARNGYRYVQQMYRDYGCAGTYPKLRSFPLQGSELEELLEAVGQREFTAQVEKDGERSWRKVEGLPRRQLTITGVKDGLELRLDSMYSISCSKYRVYFDDGKVYRVLKAETEQIEDFISCMEQLPGNWAFVEKSDIPAFGRELLPALEKHFICSRKNFDESTYGIFPVSYEVYLDAPQKDWISCRPVAVYGERSYSIFDKTHDRHMRDLAGEMEIYALLSLYFNTYDEEKKELVLTGDEDKLYLLLTQGITSMQEYAAVYVSEALKRLRVVERPKVKLGISLSSGLLDLDIDVDGIERDELAEILSRYNRKKKYYRLKNGSFLNLEDEQIEALFELKQGLHLTSKGIKQGKIQLPGYRAMYLDTQLREYASLTANKDKKFRALIRNMKTIEDNDYEIPKEQEAILREYQKQGFLWMKTLKQNGFGGILADDMGLGKTLQVITFLWSEYLGDSEGKNRSEYLEDEDGKNKRGLIITPASLVFNWASEIERFAPGLPVKMVVGTATQRQTMIENSGNQEILITSYELLRRDIAHYKKITFAYEVIDEAQYIKNHGTQSAKAVKSVHASFKMALTGTPVENRLSELWSIFDYLMPGFLYSYEQFRRELEQPMIIENDEKAKQRLQKMIRPFVLRRLKKDVLKDLPDKIEKDMYAKLEGEQEKLYEAHVKRLQMVLGKQTPEEFNRSKIQILAEITKLRQICCHPGLLYEDYHSNSSKLDMCLELIQNAVNGGHKILLFSQFTSMLELLEKRMQEEGISYYSLTGATPKERRNELVQAFNQDDTSVFCISLKAGGTGLNLTAADIVIHYDPWWNVAVQNQATDRAHRIGQRSVVSVYKLFVKGSIEEKIKKLQEKKMELSDQILGGDGLDSSIISKEELIQLL